MADALRGTLLATLVLILGLGGFGCSGTETGAKEKAPPKVDMEKKKEEMQKTREKMKEVPKGPEGEGEKTKEKEKDKEKD